MLETGTYTRKDGTFIRYERYKPDDVHADVGLVYLHGLLSCQKCKKATFVKEFAIAHQLPYLVFDFTAHGESWGKPEDVRIGRCFRDACDMIREKTTGPQIVLGSSMGGWTGLLLAQEMPDRIAGFIGLAAAPDFTHMLWNHVLKDEQRAFLKKGGILGPTEETKGYCFCYDFFEDAKKYFLLNKKIRYNQPVVLIKGDKDFLVPDSVAFKIKDNLLSEDVAVWTLKGAEHPLSRPSDLEAIETAIEFIFKRVNK